MEKELLMNAKAQHILFILDRSGSMAEQASDVIGGFNTYIGEMKSEAVKDGLATFVSLVTFATDHSVVFAGKPVADVAPLDGNSYRAMGSTALLDAVHDAVTKYLERIGQGTFGGGSTEDAPPVLVIIFTDGFENASRSASWAAVQELIQKCESLGNWTFTYIGAHPDAWSQANRLNVQRGNVLDAADIASAGVTLKMVESTKRHRSEYRDFDRKSSENLFEELEESAGVKLDP
jgi:uncharacterized protein YegL